MTDTPNIALPLIAAAQAQKHVTHNEALERLDALVQLSVEDISQTPPASPVEGQRHICAAAATGDWTGHDHYVAAWQGGAWVFFAPRAGWRAWVVAEALLKVFDGSNWSAASAGGGGSVNFQNIPLAGVNATADTSNRLTVSSPNSLFNHEGTDHRLKINRATASDTASVVFQSGFSGRAEFGITGDDRFRLKVSADGGSWVDALDVEPATGKVSLRLAPNATGEATLIDPAHSSQPLLMPYGQFGYSAVSIVLNTNYWRYKLPYYFSHDISLSRLVFCVKTAGAAGAKMRMGLRRWNRDAGWSFRELLFESAEIDVDTTGTRTITLANVTVPAGWYALDVACNDGTVSPLGVAWNYVARTAFGSTILGDTVRPVNVLYSIDTYGPLPADDLGVSYNVPHFSVGNFAIGLG